MFTKNSVLAAIALAGVMVSGGASAELVSAENGFAVYDSETSTFWMNLHETAGLSIDALTSEMTVGGKYEGWSFASAESVYELFSLNVEGYDENRHLTSYYITEEIKENWNSFFGETWNGNSSGFYYDGNNWRIAGAYRDGYPREGDNVFFTESDMDSFDSYAVPGYSYYGHFLTYSGTLKLDESADLVGDVPLPLWGMGALGLFALGFARKKKKA
tara:strand:- start:86 stop:733 length:648 start_codon:yes stop_codon:yes gene_type:complete